MTSTIISVFVSVPLLFQSVAAAICPSNQYVAPGVNVCYQITASRENPNGVDSNFIDMVAGQWLRTEWITSSTMLSRVESLDGSCYEWRDADWEATTTCEFTNQSD